MDFAAANAWAHKRLAQRPALNKKVRDAAAQQDFSLLESKTELAAAQQQLARLQQAVQPDCKSQAYSDKGGPISSSSKFTKKLLTCEDVKAVLESPIDAMIAAAAAAKSAKDATSVASSAAPAGTAAPAGGAATAAIVPPAAGPGSPSHLAAPTAPGLPDAVPCQVLPEPAAKDLSQPTGTGTAAAAEPGGPQLQLSACSGVQQPAAASSCHSSNRSHRSQHLQQLAKADSLLAEISEFIQTEVPPPAVAASSSLQIHCPNATTAAAAGAAGLDAAGWFGSVERSTSSNGRGGDGSSGEDLLSPELLSSVALRFQAFNQQTGCMPSIAAMAEAVRQQVVEEELAKQLVEKQRLAHHFAVQQALLTAGQRHQELYEHGVALQRRKLLEQQPGWQHFGQRWRRSGQVAGSAPADQAPATHHCSSSSHSAAAVTTAAAGTAAAHPGVAHHQQQLAPSPPPRARYKAALGGAGIIGSSHGYLSPADTTFHHLPGSRRQVRAQIQDAAAMASAIQAAEQTMRKLCYAPAGVTNKSGGSSPKLHGE